MTHYAPDSQLIQATLSVPSEDIFETCQTLLVEPIEVMAVRKR